MNSGAKKSAVNGNAAESVENRVGAELNVSLLCVLRQRGLNKKSQVARQGEMEWIRG